MCLDHQVHVTQLKGAKGIRGFSSTLTRNLNIYLQGRQTDLSASGFCGRFLGQSIEVYKPIAFHFSSLFSFGRFAKLMERYMRQREIVMRHLPAI